MSERGSETPGHELGLNKVSAHITTYFQLRGMGWWQGSASGGSVGQGVGCEELQQEMENQVL